MSGRRTRLAATAVAGALVASLAPPAVAAADPAAAEQPAPEDVAGRHSSDIREPLVTARSTGSTAGFRTAERTVPVAPGLTHTSFDRYDARGWIRVDVLTADLSTPGLRLDYVGQSKVTDTAPLTRALGRRRAVAGVNADFFDIGDTGAPLGMGVDRRRGVLHGVASGRNLTFNVTRAKVARIAQTFLRAEVTPKGRDPIPVTNLNSPTIDQDGIGVYTPRWGSVARRRVLPGRGGREVLVVNGRVRRNDKTLSTGPIKAGTVELVGVGRGALKLSRLGKGTRLAVDYGLNDEAVRVAVGGNAPLLRNGEINAPGDPAMHPRTAIGVDEDTGKALVVTVDGRQSHSRGLTLRETAQLMKRLGADNALNLDGGGSSTMLARESGEPSRIVNAPSDGRLRPVANGLGFSVTNGSGRLRGIRVEPDRGAADSHRVLRGLSRVLVARGHDEGMNPVTAKPGWRGSKRVSVRRAASARTVAVGRERGVGSVTAAAGAATGRFRLTVLGRVHRLETSVPRISLAGRSGSRSFDLRGYDARGFGTWVQPRDVKLRYDRKALEVRRTGRGFSVRAKVRSTSEVIRVSAGGKHTFVGVTVGLARRVADRMNTLRGWTADARPAAASARLGPAKDRAGRGGRAIALRYAFGRSRKTRVASLNASGGRELAGKARKIGVWVRGDGRGALLRLVVKDASGRRTTLNLARRVTWKGWRLVTAPLPGDLAEPARALRIYAAEQDRKRRYKGRLVFDDLAVWTERSAKVPVTAPLRDPLVRASTALPGGGLRVAVLAGANLRAAKPESPAARRTRRAMREAVAAGAELVLLDGDLVGHGGAADLAFARRMIEEELDGTVPWRYVPGDGELDGTGTLGNFRAEFGDPVRAFDRAGTRFVLLNSARGTFRLGGFGQLVRLRSELALAGTDDSVSGVIVVAHHPTSDPSSGGTSELADSREGDLVEDLLADFRASSGKRVGYVASHTRRFGMVRDDDVPTVLAGAINRPARVGLGSFAGWSMLRLAPDTASWLGAELRPTVDALRLAAPASMAVGGAKPVTARLTQNGRRRQVRYPMNAVWGGSRIFVGKPGRAPQQAVAAYTPTTGRLTALRRGEATLTLEVNGSTAARTVAVK